MAKRKKSVADGFPDITQENLGELALLCLRRCDHYYGAKQVGMNFSSFNKVACRYIFTAKIQENNWLSHIDYYSFVNRMLCPE